MRKWYDADTRRTYVRIDNQSEINTITDRLSWRGIVKTYGVSRMTAFRCLRDLERSDRLYNPPADPDVLFILMRVPSMPARTIRVADRDAVATWFICRNSVGNPRFTDSAYQSQLARRPRSPRM